MTTQDQPAGLVIQSVELRCAALLCRFMLFGLTMDGSLGMGGCHPNGTTLHRTRSTTLPNDNEDFSSQPLVGFFSGQIEVVNRWPKYKAAPAVE